ncbi:MAG: hypothetical protein ABSC65_30425 [Acidobacteriaceae bacterium]|jgi:hypothetical protein
MSPRMKLMSAGMALFVLTMAGLTTLYQVLFDVWMTAYPFANTNEWRTRLYVRVATFVLIGVFWSALVAWMVRQRRRG